MTRQANIVKEPSGRPERTPVGRRNILSVKGKDPDFEYRIVNDEYDRVDSFKDAGWEVVSNSDVRVGDKRVGQTSAVSSAATVSVGQGMKGVVMRIKKDWYEEDAARKRADAKSREATSRTDATNGADYGKIFEDRS